MLTICKKVEKYAAMVASKDNYIYYPPLKNKSCQLATVMFAFFFNEKTY